MFYNYGVNSKRVYLTIVFIIILLAVVFVIFYPRGETPKEEILDSQNTPDVSYTPDSSYLNPAEKANPFKKVKTNPFE